MSALANGGAGFIGSALVRALGNGESVVTVDKLTYAGNFEKLGPARDDPRHRFVHADVCDRAAMAAVLAKHRPRRLFHLAAENHVDRSIDGPLGFVETNVLGMATLLEASLDYWRRLDMRYAVDPHRIEQELGSYPRRDFEEGLAATVTSSLANPEWCRRAGCSYRQERLGIPSTV